MRYVLSTALLGCYLALPALAQHHHTPGMTMPKDTMPGMEMPRMVMPSGKPMSGMLPGKSMRGKSIADTSMPDMMTHSFSRNLPMNRNGSGTSWHPDNTPMYAYMGGSGKWSLMAHYSVFLRYTSQNSNNRDRRGSDQQVDAPNWFMGMAQRKVGERGLLLVRVMLSLDALTVGNGGYPLLFQSGESYRGQPLIDRQHPHDLFSELSVGYTYAFTKDIDLYGYVGYPGEPALGPPAFMHRISSFNNPDATLGHHWQDATHILFGVATVGFRYKWAKLEASSFTGREPNENRFNFDRPRFDSYSYRISVNPSPALALQFSQGYIRSPEDLHPTENVTRTTASLLHSKGLGKPDRYITSAFIWGMNQGHGTGENSFLAESSLQLDRMAVYGRLENIGKSPEELGLDTQFPDQRVLTINALTLGMNYRLVQHAGSDLVVGAQATVNAPEKVLQPIYGTMPLSGEVYLRITPSLMTMRGMGSMHHQ